MNKRFSEIRVEAALTQEKFAQRMGISKNYVTLIETGKKNPGDRLISDICREFNVNETWLRTGEGEMYAPQTRNQEIQSFVNGVMANEDEAFKKRFISALSKARPEFWDELERFVLEIKKD